MTNHLATNLITKGLLNISDITKGMIVLGYQIVVTGRSRGGGAYAAPIVLPYKGIEDERELFRDIRQYEDIDVIKIKVEWKKNYNGDRLVEATLIKRHIEAEILEKTGKSINVEIIE